MKKSLLFLFVLLSLISCKKEEKDYRTNLVVIDLLADKWDYVATKDGMNTYFAARFNQMPEITKEVFDNGILNVYALLDDGQTQQQLPYTRHYEYVDEQTKTVNYYTQTIDYDYGVGFLNVFFTASDFAYEVNEDVLPEQMRFRVVMMW